MLDFCSSTGSLLGAAGLDALVVVVDGDGQRLLRVVLADHVAVEELVDLLRLGQRVERDVGGLGELLLDDLVAQVDALVADVDAGASDELLDLLLALAAEGALEQVATVTDACHPMLLHVLRSRRILRSASDWRADWCRRARYDGTAPDGHRPP